MSIFGWWKSGEDKPLLKDSKAIEKKYKNSRTSVIWSVVLGYGIFYIGRLTISVAKKPMLDSGIIDARDIIRHEFCRNCP